MRKASLNLSVNAIIIFVLAFAMLGVGILVTGRLEELGIGGIEKAKTIIENIEEDPTADNVLVGIGKELKIPANKKFDSGIKLYNKGGTEYTEGIIVIDDCKDTSDKAKVYKEGFAVDGITLDPTMKYPVMVVSETVTIGSSSFEPIPFTIKNERLNPGNTYICKLKLVDEATEVTEYFTYSFHLTVES